MVLLCNVLGCSNKSSRESSRHFYRLPKVIKNQGTECEQLSGRRRRLWLAVLNQNLKGRNLDYVRVCSDHFISGTKAGLYDQRNLDWVPSLKIGICTNTPTTTHVISRYTNLPNRARKPKAAKVLMDLAGFPHKAATFLD